MLSLEPRNELVFKGPLNHVVRKTLVIRNPIKNQKVAFKLKTTTPRMFSVRPNVGVLGPEEKIDVEIHMHPNVPETGKKQHKFLIQAALAIGDVDDLREFWKVQTPANIWDTKIKCVIAPYKASDDNLRQAGGSGAGEADFDPQEAFEKVAKLVKEIKKVKDNRLALEKAAQRRREARNLGRSKHRGRDLFKFACCVLTIVAAILGAYYGKYYL